MDIEIHWNGFIKLACEAYPKEACAMLYAKKPFATDQEWFVFPIKNVHPNPEEGWIPDKAELSKLKQKTDKMGLVKIGNVHSHPYTTADDDKNPSDTDLKFARKFNDIVRGILVVDNEGIYGHCWHDKFGNEIYLSVTETRSVEEGNNGKKDSSS